MSEKRKPETSPSNGHKRGKTEEKGKEASEKGKYETELGFKQLLLNSSVESLAYQKKGGVVFFVDRTDRISDVFKGLVKQHFLSVPVLQKTKHKWYGFIEISDIVHFYVQHFGDQLGDEGKKVWETIAEREGFLEKTVTEIMKNPNTRKNPFHPITPGYSLFYAIETLARENDLRRIPIVDQNRNLKSVLSQSQVIQFIFENISSIGSIKDKPVREMKNVMKEVHTIGENERAIDAFKLMQEKGVGGVAVVNEEGRLTGALSERDLKAIRLEDVMFHRLFQKVHNFIRHLREEFQTQHNRPKTLQVVHLNSTLEHVTEVLVSHEIHRVYIVDDEKKPIGVVSLKDVLLEIISN